MHYELDYPPPEAAEHEIASMPPKVPLRDYRRAMQQMKDKGYSYQEVTDWICKFLGVEVTRSQVIYVLTTPSFIQKQEEDEEWAADEVEKLTVSPTVIESTPPAANLPAKKAPRGKKKTK